LGGSSQPIRIVRTQDDEDVEQISIALGGAPASLTWSPKQGAKSGAAAAAGVERGLIERIALDSPDQFVLAQTRGASYYRIAGLVRPADVADPETYTGPLWDLVRVVEPQRGTGNKPESLWRIYYVNCSTGLIDKILYQQQGETVTVELTGWTNQGGELSPSTTRWSRGGQVVMQLSYNSVTHGPK
jgi:hypothetical protein